MDMSRYERLHIGRQGPQKERASHLLRHTFRPGGKLREGTLNQAGLAEFTHQTTRTHAWSPAASRSPTSASAVTGPASAPDRTAPALCTTVPAGDLGTATVVTACQNQAHLRRDLQAVKAAPTFHSFMAASGHIQP